MQSKLKDREKQILQLLYEEEGISMQKLCDIFNVTVVTIRKDLDRLEANGLIVRTHGGAYPLYDKELMDRKKENAEEKMRIAKAAAEMIGDGERVMITSGTTTSLIPKFLYGKRNVHIVTNSTLLLTYSRMNPNVSVTLLGGEFMSDAEALTGSVTLRELDMFHTDKAFIGCDGFSLEGGISANHTELSEVCRKIISRVNKLYLLSDSSKYDKTGFAYIDRMENIDTLITDSGLSDAGAASLKKIGVDVVRV